MSERERDIVRRGRNAVGATQETLSDGRTFAVPAALLTEALDEIDRLRALLSSPEAGGDVEEEQPMVVAPRESSQDRQWRETGMWQEFLSGYPAVTDAQRHADLRYRAVERWVYRVLAIGNCPGSYPVSAAIIHDLDRLRAPDEGGGAEEMRAIERALTPQAAKDLAAMDGAAADEGSGK